MKLMIVFTNSIQIKVNYFLITIMISIITIIITIS